MTKAKKQSSGRKKKAWHITDFRELFELPDDLRKDRPGPLSYTKSFVTLSGISKEYEIKHFERLQELKSRPERHLLRSIFEDLKNWSGTKTIKHRGYLLTTAEQPATYEYLAGQLKVDIEELKQAMPILEEIGLVERVPIETLPGDKQPTKPKKKQRAAAGRTKKKSVKKKKSSKKKSEAPDTSGRIRTHPDASGKNRTALYKRNGKGNGKRKSNSKSKANEQIDNDNPKTERNNNRQQRGNDNSNSVEGKPTRQTKSATTDCRQAAVAPATTPPFMPQASDARGSRVIPFVQAPSGSVKHKGPQRLGEILEQTKHRYDQDAQQFGGDIYRALNLPWEVTSNQGKRELGCFASCWMKAKAAGMDAAALEELRVRAIQETGKLAKRRGKRGNVSAIWCTVFKRLLASRGSKGKCKVM